MVWQVVLSFCCLTGMVFGKESVSNTGHKRSSGTPSYNELSRSKPEVFNIASTECSFKKSNDPCDITYAKTNGLCPLNMVALQLFPDINIASLTNEFIVPDKFLVDKIKMNDCDGDPEKGQVVFKAKSTESVELIPQYLSLGAETALTLKWKPDEPLTPENILVTLDGRTSIGNDHNVQMTMRKTAGTDYDLNLNMASLIVNDFFASFRIDTASMIDSDLNQEKRALGLGTIVIKNPNIDGVFSPGGGFEIVATGIIEAPELPADASKFFLIVQDFKKGDSDAQQTEFAQPVGGIFALYRKESIRDAIMSLTGISLPELEIFKRVNKVAITAASKEIFNINSKELQRIAGEYVPMEGLNMIMQGLSVSHYSRNTNQDIKDTQDKPVDKVMFRCDITKDKLIWTSPYDIESQLMKYVSMVWSEQKGFTSLRLAPDTKGIFVSIDYVKNTKTVQVNFNLTQSVPVLKNGLVSLLNTTITLYTEVKNRQGEYDDWKMSGAGSESILDSLVHLTIEQTEHRTTVRAEAEIFDMKTLRNRTKAEVLPEELRETFPFVQTFPMTELQYEASFEWNLVLKFKGKLLVEDTIGKNPNLEILYFITNNGPEMKVACLFRGAYLHQVVNLFYEKEMMRESWLKFKQIAVVAKHKNKRGEVFHPFDRPPHQQADESFNGDGVGFIAEEIDLRYCEGNKWRMCSFLKLHSERFVDFKYEGRMLEKMVKMEAKAEWRTFLGTAFAFSGNEMRSVMRANKDGTKLAFEGKILLTRTFETFKGKIFDDGSNHVTLQFGGDEEDQSRKIMNLPFVRLKPLRAKFRIPSTKKVEEIELSSRLHLGTIPAEEKHIDLGGGTGRQYIKYTGGGPPQVKFIGEKSRMKLSAILEAFGISNRNKMLDEASFKNQVVAAYNSEDEVWDAKDFNAKVKKGLHFYGQLSLKSGETYEATINMLENLQLETILHLNPLRYGNVIKDSQGRISFQNVNVFLYKSDDRPELGPNLVLAPDTQRMEGYCATVGLAGQFTTEIITRSADDFDYRIKMRGKLYKETDDADVFLTAKGVDKPSELKFKYEVDLTGQAATKVNENFRDVMQGIQNAASEGKKNANKILQETDALVTQYKQQQQQYDELMSSLQEQIRSINSNIDLSILAISTDCINKCKTVAMPGIDWKQDCISQQNGEHNMKCMTWTEDKEKVVNVICVLKCEAKKVSAAGEASQDIKKVEVLLNRYRETKVLSDSLDKIIQLAEEGNDIAKKTKTMIDNKATVEGELTQLLEKPVSGNLIEIETLKVEEAVESMKPPCIKFQLNFILNTSPPKTRSGKHKICFNGEFFKNVGLRIMRESYPAIDNLYKGLNEAELRYTRIGAIRKSLTRVIDDVKESSKRSEVAKQEDDLVIKNLMKIAKRRIPGFTLKGDKTMLAFSHYSPWATAKRKNPFSAKFVTTGEKKFDMDALKEKSACQQAKHVISEYKNILESIDKVSEHYGIGKDLFGKSKVSIMKDLDDSHSDLVQQMNRTKLSNFEKKDMMFWYEFTKKGMDDYLHTFYDRLSEQNKRGLTLLRNQLSSFYGNGNFVQKFENLGSKAFARSNILTAKQDKEMPSLKHVGKELKRLLFDDGKTLDDASEAVVKLSPHMENLHHSVLSCY